MAKTRIRPNGIYGGGPGTWSHAGGAGSVNAALADSSDATYAYSNAPADTPDSLVLEMGTTAIPGTSDVAAVGVGLRSKRTVANGTLTAQLWFDWDTMQRGTPASWNGTAIADVVLTPAQADKTAAGLAWTQALIDALRIMMSNDNCANGLIYEVYADIYHYGRLTSAAAVSGGTPVTTTSKPVFPLTLTAPSAVDADQVSGGFNTIAYEIKVFSAAQYGAGGFDPSVSAAYWSSTGASSIAQGATAGSASKTSGAVLPNGSYRVYVRSKWGFPSAAFGAWAYTAFVMNVAPPDPPGVNDWLNDPAPGAYSVDVFAIPKAGYSNPVLDVDVSYDGGVTWEALASGLPGTFAPTATRITSWTITRGVRIRIRARVTMTGPGGGALTSDWLAFDSYLIPAAGWNLKVPKQPSLNLIDAQVLRDPDFSREEDMSILRPKGRTFPVVVSISLGGADGSMQIRARSGEWAALEKLLSYRAPIYLESVFGWAKWIRITSRAWQELGAAGAVRRVVKVGYVEVEPDV